ncbi:putative vesicle-associated membrane protein 726 [Vitis vinifera]|uniref:Putative vesicle-associated membrane protein 726 n=1 Tax=Vitis vinifera TaxID=29760 RepID=A0A438DID2_VITVI|nr:putative vesicle-associated membrane protein 726 [Vitis vinifera]
MVGQQSLIYSFVARGTVILAEYTEFTGNFTSIAAQCLQKLPASNNKFTYNCDGHTFNYLVENGFMVRAHDGKHEGRKRLVVVQSKSFVIFIKVVNVKVEDFCLKVPGKSERKGARVISWSFKGKDTHYCEGKDHFGGGPLRVKDFGLKVIPSDKQAYFTSPRKRSLICNKYKMLEALGEVGSNEAFPKSLNPTFCVPMPLLSPRRKMGNSRSRSVPPFSSFEKLLTSSSGCVVANSDSCLQERKLSFKAEIFWGKEMQNVTFLGGTRQPKAQGPIEEEKGASSLNQSCSWGGPEGVEVRECLQHRGSHFQVLTSTPLSMVKGVNKFPSGSIGVVSYLKGVMSPAVKPSQELKGVLVLSISQNNPSEPLSQTDVCLWSQILHSWKIFFVKETKRELGDRRFVRSVWKVRNKEWAVLPTSGAFEGVAIFWDAVTFKCLEEGFLVGTSRSFRLNLFEMQGLLRKGELEEVLLKKEVFWRQKSIINWIKEGDCNSKFFHKVANDRRNRKFIKSLVLEDGVVLDNIESILEEIKCHFGKLFSKPLRGSWRIEGLDWSPISVESAEWLNRPFSEEEIHNAVLHLSKEKAPSSNGFTIGFYQECWETIKDDLLRVFLEFHNNGIINQSTNATFIALVPKKSQTSRISYYKPISLVTGAFVEDRQILDVVLIANELVDEKRRSKEEEVLFKIDFENAYDHVDWDFLDHVFEKA